MRLKLNCGKVVRVWQMHQRHIYAGISTGVPTREGNRRIVERAEEEACEKLGLDDDTNVFLFEPKERIEATEMSDGPIKFPVLPPYETTILLDDPLEARLVVVMFSERLGLTKEDIEKLRTVDWDEAGEIW